VEAINPDVIVTDIAMPGLEGTAASELLARRLGSRVVLITVCDDSELVERGHAAALVPVVRKALRGERQFPGVRARARSAHEFALQWAAVRARGSPSRSSRSGVYRSRDPHRSSSGGPSVTTAGRETIEWTRTMRAVGPVSTVEHSISWRGSPPSRWRR
jgi:DNA-binding NarL/FixJ family response regulator